MGEGEITYSIHIKDVAKLEKFLTERYLDYVRANPWSLSQDGRECAKAYKRVIGDLIFKNIVSVDKIFLDE